MAPLTTGGLAGGMAHGSHIHHETYGFIGANRPTPTSAFNRILDLRPGDLDPAVYGGHTFRTILSDSILEFTYIGRLEPSLITDHGQVFHLGSQKTMAHDKLTSDILLGNHKVIRTNGSVPISSFHPI